MICNVQRYVEIKNYIFERRIFNNFFTSPASFGQSRCQLLFDSLPVGIAQFSAERSGVLSWIERNYFRLLETELQSSSHSQNMTHLHYVLLHSKFKEGPPLVTFVDEFTVLVTKDYRLKNRKIPDQDYVVRATVEFHLSSQKDQPLVNRIFTKNSGFVVFGIQSRSTNLNQARLTPSLEV